MEKALSIVAAARRWQMNTRRQFPLHKNGIKDVNICIKMSRWKTREKKRTKNSTTTTSTIKVMVGFVWPGRKCSVFLNVLQELPPSPPLIPSTHYCVPFSRTYFVSDAFLFSWYFFREFRTMLRPLAKVCKWVWFVCTKMNGYFRMECRCEIKFERPFLLRSLAEEISWAQEKQSILH